MSNQSPFTITKKDYKNFKVCFKQAWIAKTNDHLMQFLKWEKAKKLSYKPVILQYLINDPIDWNKLTLNTTNPLTPEQINALNKNPNPKLWQGNEVGTLARDWYASRYKTYADLSTLNLKQALKKTQAILQDSKTEVIFEAAFQTKNCITRADILVRDFKIPNSWELIEVKSSSMQLNRDGVSVKTLKNKFLYDVSYQYSVINRQPNINLSNVRLQFLNKDYHLAGTFPNLAGLFIQLTKLKNQTLLSYCQEQQAVVEQELMTLNRLFQNAKHDPLAMLQRDSHLNDVIGNAKPASRSNNFHHCDHVYPYVDLTDDNSVFYLERKSFRAITLLREHNITKMNEIPQNFNFGTQDKNQAQPFTKNQELQIKTSQSKVNTPFLQLKYRQQIKDLLDKYCRPLYFYDFETVDFAIPRYLFTKPYQKIPFQYALDVIDQAGNEHHTDFIATNNLEWRLAIIEQLVADLTQYGPGKYVVYNQSFEKTIVNQLIEYLKFCIAQQPDSTPKYAKYIKQLTMINDNTLDLMDLFKNFKIYDPGFKGSISIKKVLPVFHPAYNYDNLAIRQGDVASELFAQYVLGFINPEVWRQYFEPAFIKYCGRDTRAMVLLYRSVKDLITIKYT